MSRKYRRVYMGMKYLRMYENFNESKIHAICKEYYIKNYTINNGLVDVDGHVFLQYKKLTELPLKFGDVTGGFYCYNNQLTTLEGCPVNVQGSFDCKNNKLTSLMNGPKYVGEQFLCNNNQLTTLEGCPSEVYLECYGNPVEVIYNLFPNQKSFIDSLDYNYFRGGNKINKIRLTHALEELDIECPENIEGYIWE